MRGQARAVTLAATGLAAGALLAGCTLPDGVDGDIASGWAAMPEAVGFVPDAAVCHEGGYQRSGTLDEYQPIDCAEPHLTETVFVGEFTEVDDETSAPSEGTSTWRSAYRECDEAAADYLGADFRYARLWLGVTVPSDPAWEGGARWFRCEVVAFDNQLITEQTRSGSLAGTLADAGELRMGCFDVTLSDNEQDIDQMDPIDCDEPHHAEFVGVWEAPDGDYLDGSSTDSAEQVHEGCREEVAEFADLPVDGDLRFRTGTIADWMDEDDWDNGDRKFRCYLWLNGEEITGSMAGAGTSEFPVR